jgi:hypothetical protein
MWLPRRVLGSFSLMVVASLTLAGCARSAAPARFEAHGPACSAHQQELLTFTQNLSERALGSSVKVDLAETTVGELPGPGRVLEISSSEARLDTELLPGASLGERVAALRERLAKASEPGTASSPPPLYVAGAADLDVQTVRAYLEVVPESVALRWLVRMPAPPTRPTASGADAGRELSLRMLAEHDPSARRELARQGYAEFSRCSAVTAALASVDARPAAERWPALQRALVAALPRCDCSELDAENFEQLLLAEQRAGSATLASLPLGFLRDARCGASMPLRSLRKLSAQIEEFDREFAGKWQDDAIRFEKVISDEHLLNTFCNALPGETLAAFEKARATLYWKLPATEACEAWRFEPLSPGAPLGTWRRVGEGAPLAFHYWQAAEELRLFGPLTPGVQSLPTDTHPWACDQNQRLTEVDARSIRLEHGRWFFSDAACRAAPEADAVAGCSAERRSVTSPAETAGASKR